MDSSDLALLTTLDALLQESSVSRAAERLGLSTPAVSHALSRLRDRFDDPLLVRAGRSMVLTPRAVELAPRVRNAITHAEQVFSEPDAVDLMTVERAFALSATDYVMTLVGHAFSARVSEEAPYVDLRILLNAVDDPQRLRRGESDLAIGIYADLPPELRTRPVIEDRLVCVVRDDHPDVGTRMTPRKYVTLEHVQVAPRGRPGGYVDRLLHERGESRRVARALPFFEAALQMIANSNYVLTISERIARLHADALNLKILAPPLPFEPYALSMVWHPRFDADVTHRWLRQTFAACCADLEPTPRARRKLTRAEARTRRR